MKLRSIGRWASDVIRNMDGAKVYHGARQVRRAAMGWSNRYQSSQSEFRPSAEGAWPYSLRRSWCRPTIVQIGEGWRGFWKCGQTEQRLRERRGSMWPVFWMASPPDLEHVYPTVQPPISLSRDPHTPPGSMFEFSCCLLTNPVKIYTWCIWNGWNNTWKLHVNTWRWI